MPETDFDDWTGRRLAAFRRRVRNWYRRQGRDMAWRRSREPYRIWISEIMLQQTTVAAVGPYFERFLQRFPTVQELAAAEEEDVLRIWEGLGYYSRARNMHKTAGIVANELDGDFPTDVVQLQSLPGIGRYTAGAIASFAFDRPAPIVEANTLRLYCRLLGHDGDPRSSAGQSRLWSFAEQIVPTNAPGEFNHALMDLGATVCRIRDPHCDGCPLRGHCRSFAEDRVAEIPRPAKRPEIEDVTEAAVIVRKQGRVLLRRRNEGERWAGLWDFPRFAFSVPVEDIDSPGTLHDVETHVREQTGISAEIKAFVTEIRHCVTRFRIRLRCYAGTHRDGSLRRAAGLKWIPVRQLDDYPLSVTGRKIARLVAEKTKTADTCHWVETTKHGSSF